MKLLDLVIWIFLLNYLKWTNNCYCKIGFLHITCALCSKPRQIGTFVEKLLGQKTVDEIDSLFPCLRIFWMKNFAIPVAPVLHYPKMLHNIAQGHYTSSHTAPHWLNECHPPSSVQVTSLAWLSFRLAIFKPLKYTTLVTWGRGEGTASQTRPGGRNNPREAWMKSCFKVKIFWWHHWMIKLCSILLCINWASLLA